MVKPKLSDNFKRDAAHQIKVRGYPVCEASRRCGVSTCSLLKWMKQYAQAASKASDVDHEAENRPHVSLGNNAPKEFVADMTLQQQAA